MAPAQLALTRAAGYRCPAPGPRHCGAADNRLGHLERCAWPTQTRRKLAAHPEIG
jgi:hypothetical protein